MFQAMLDPVGGSLGLSALVACIPLVTFFIMLLGVKAKAHISAVVALCAALVVAIVGFQMPGLLALLSATQGAAFGAFPIVYIILMAVWFYEVTVVSGRSEDLRKFFDQVGGGDIRIQAMMIAFCFGGLLEALAGFGAPIAVTATMILALGVKPKKAALTVLLANTAPVAYGAVATPITTAGNMVASITGSGAATAQHVAAIVGYQAPLFAVFVPFLIVVILDGKQGAKDCVIPAFVVGICFAVTQWACSNFFAYVQEDLQACEGKRNVVRASAFERLTVRRVSPDEMHVNPDDEFAKPEVGPNDRIINEYAHEIPRFMQDMIPVFPEPIMVYKIKPEGYLILNGHHRWAAAVKTGLGKVRVAILNPPK